MGLVLPLQKHLQMQVRKSHLTAADRSIWTKQLQTTQQKESRQKATFVM